MKKKEPIRYSMSTGLPRDDEVKKYPMESAEQSFLNFIAKHKKSREEYQEKIKKELEKNN
jgi:hypothetical protein